MYWPALKETEINSKVFGALKNNINFRDNILLGIPGTHLDQKVFPLEDVVEGRPYLTSFVANPNHIGLHTTGSSEVYFKGTHEIEREAIRICAEEIMQAEADSINGYVASGGTEANIQGLWQLRNYYQNKYQCKTSEIAILHSEDTHYSVYKASNLLSIEAISLNVDEKSRQINTSDLKSKLSKAKDEGVKYFILFANMGTTMFGAIDDLEQVEPILNSYCSDYWIHIDAAFGGFIYPFTNTNSNLNFSNRRVSSITMDAHKMLQAPYGTGIFLSRKEFSEYTHTSKASYVKGSDTTLCGSRSGANAISVWMILSSYGSQGGINFCEELIKRTNFLCDSLKEKEINFYRCPYMNIVTIPSCEISQDIAKKYHLVFDREVDPNWYKIVVMDHVKVEHLKSFLSEVS